MAVYFGEGAVSHTLQIVPSQVLSSVCTTRAPSSQEKERSKDYLFHWAPPVRSSEAICCKDGASFSRRRQDLKRKLHQLEERNTRDIHVTMSSIASCYGLKMSWLEANMAMTATKPQDLVTSSACFWLSTNSSTPTKDTLVFCTISTNNPCLVTSRFFRLFDQPRPGANDGLRVAAPLAGVGLPPSLRNETSCPWRLKRLGDLLIRPWVKSPYPQ